VLKRLLLTVCLACLFAGCTGPQQGLRRPLIDEGELYLYCEPFPPEASRLRFAMAGIAALRADGVEIPLTVEMAEFKTSTVSRQRLCASGILPPGSYVGLSYRVKSAAMLGEDGEGAMLVPERPHANPVNFTIASGKATILDLSLNYRESTAGGVRFTPTFTSLFAMAPLPGLTGYLTNRASNTVTVFDKRSARVGGVIETGRGPSGIVLDQVRRRAYVAISGEDAVDVIDVAEHAVIARIRLNPGDAPHSLVITPDGKFIVTANTGSNTASILDALSQMEVARFTVGNSPEFVVSDRSGKRAYVFNRLSNTISVIDIEARQLAWTIATEAGPLYGQFNRKGDRLYVFHELSPYLLIIDPVSQTVIRRVNAGTGTGALKVNTFTDQIYLGKQFGGIIDIYDPFSFIPGDFLNVQGGVSYLTIDGEENNLLVLTPRSRALRMINLIGKKEQAVLDTGEEPYWVAIFGER